MIFFIFMTFFYNYDFFIFMIFRIEGIERNWCEGRRIKHSRKQLCHAGYECVEQSEDRLLTLSCKYVNPKIFYH